MLSDTSSLLAQLTDSAAIVVGPENEQLVVRSSLLARLSSRTALLAVVLSNGAVEKRTLAISEDVPDEDINAASAYLQQHFADRSLSQLAPDGVSLEESGRPEVDALVAGEPAAAWAADAERPQRPCLCWGAARMAERFQAVEQVRAVLTILEQSYVVVSLLKDVLAHGQTFAIGSENGLASLSECSLVVAPFEGDGHAVGTIGDPRTDPMDYPQALAAVAVVGRRLTRKLQQGRGKVEELSLAVATDYDELLGVGRNASEDEPQEGLPPARTGAPP